MKEIRALPNIMTGDYKALVPYKMCVINNHTRLSGLGSEHDISSTDTMQQLMSKLLWAQVEKWSEYFEEQDEETKVKPFKLFLKWLEKIGGSWEVVVALGVGRKGRSKSEHC